MAIRFKAGLATFVCCFLSSPIFAAEPDDNPNSYIAINAGLSQEKNACATTLTVGASCKDTYPVYRIAYGYQFTRAWGLEVSYGDLAYAEEKGTFPTAPPPATGTNVPYTWSLKATGWAISGIGTLHLGDRFALFGKAGLVRAEFKEDGYFPAGGSPTGWWQFLGTVNTALTHVTYGGGVQFEASHTVALRAQYEDFGSYDIFNGGAPIKIKMASAGLMFRF